MKKEVKRYIEDTDGVVTVEWVVLLCLMATSALFVFEGLVSELEDMAEGTVSLAQANYEESQE